MRIYLIADTHFNHDKLIEACGRPQNHTEVIGRNLLLAGLVAEDVLIHLGDICVGGDVLVHESYIRPLACKKWLVLGNHDGKSLAWYITHGWDWVGLTFSLRRSGKQVLFSHAPVPDSDGQSFDLNVHGHLHNTSHHAEDHGWACGPKHRLLAIENTGYRPVLLDDFLRPLGPGTR